MKGKGGSGYAQLTKQLLSKHKLVDIPLIRATPTSLSRYGALLKSKDETLTQFKNETWPKSDGWRSISNGTGNEALPAIGNFDHFWRKYDNDNNDGFYVCCAKNEAISRSYETAIYDDNNRYIYCREMNYHPCGNQLLFPINERQENRLPFIALLARSKENKHYDDIDFDDIKAFYFDGDKYGLNIFSGTWHQPSFPYYIFDGDIYRNNIKLYNVQSSVHACVVYDSIDEFDSIMKIKLPENVDNID